MDTPRDCLKKQKSTLQYHCAGTETIHVILVSWLHPSRVLSVSVVVHLKVSNIDAPSSSIISHTEFLQKIGGKGERLADTHPEDKMSKLLICPERKLHT